MSRRISFTLLGVVALLLIGVSTSMTAPSPQAAKVTVQVHGLQNAYKIGQPISGTIEVHADGEFKHGRLAVAVVDPDACESAGNCPRLFEKCYAVNLEKGGSKSFDFRLPPGNVTSYSLQAILTTGADTRCSANGIDESGHIRETVAQVEARFGIRQAELENVPDNILKGKAARLNAADLQHALEMNSQRRTPTEFELSPGEKIKVKVERTEVLAPGVELPDIETPISYRGRLLKTDGKEDMDSVVDLHFVNGALSGTVIHGRKATEPRQEREQTFIDPETSYDPDAAPDMHVIYRKKHTTPPVGLRAGDAERFHQTPDQPEAEHHTARDSWFRVAVLTPVRQALEKFWRPAAEWIQTAMPPFVSPAVAQSSPRQEKYTLRVAAYEHYESSGRTENRYNLLVRALNQMLVEFQNQTPLDERNIIPDSDRKISLSQYLIIGWNQIPTTGYVDDTDTATKENLGKFEVDPNVTLPPDDPALRVLFTTLGTSTAPGVARRSRKHSVINDGTTKSWDWYTVAVLQEFGHNLDRTSGGGQPSYDAHLDSLIGENWEEPYLCCWTRRQCTAMRAGYANCSDDLAYYARDAYTTPRERLAFGLPFFSNRDPDWVARRANETSDIGIGADGSVWTIGVATTDAAGNRRIYKFDPNTNQFQQNGSDGATLRSGVRIAVAPTGAPWIVTAAGAVFRKTDNNVTNLAYDLLPTVPGGGASDIGIGDNGLVWVIGKPASDGNGQIFTWTGSAWQLVPGNAKRIAVGPTGAPWVVTAAGAVFSRNQATGNFELRPGSGVADIAIGGGTVAMTGPWPGNTHIWEPALGIWRPIPRSSDPSNGDVLGRGGVVIAVDLNGLPWIATPVIPLFSSGATYAAIRQQ